MDRGRTGPERRTTTTSRSGVGASCSTEIPHRGSDGVSDTLGPVLDEIDFIFRGGIVVDGTGRAGPPGRRRRQGRPHRRRRRPRRRGRRDRRRHRSRRGPGHHRPALPLRRPAAVGPAGHAVQLPRRHHHRQRQLRLRPRPAHARRRRLPPPHDGPGRGHAPPRARERASTGTGSRFAEYLDRLDGTIGVNAAFMAGHCAIRRYVMGEEAVGSEATPDQIAADGRRCSTG